LFAQNSFTLIVAGAAQVARRAPGELSTPRFARDGSAAVVNKT